MHEAPDLRAEAQEQRGRSGDVQLEDELVAELDRRCGYRRRSAFVSELIRRALDDERRWDDVESALGAIADTDHEWDDDPGAWVQAQRRSDVRRSG